MTDTHKNTPKPNPPATSNPVEANALSPQDHIKLLCERLANSLYNSPSDHGVLDEQVQVLNSLFHATLAAHLDLDKKRYGYDTQQGWLDMALKIQKQCTETVRTQKAIEYMNGLTTINANKMPIPAPTYKNGETK